MTRTNGNNTIEVGILILASARQDKIARWKEGLLGIANLFYIDNFDLLKHELEHGKPEILLLDRNLPGLDGVRGVSELRKLCHETKIVIFSDSASDEDEWAMFKAGVRGCCSADIAPSSLKMVIVAVRNRELWMRRTLTDRLLEQLKEKAGEQDKVNHAIQDRVRHANLCLIEDLSHREYEIAARVANGESNKQIAYSLDITERTVKAHLTKIFHKLGVTGRHRVAAILLRDTH